MTVTAQAGPELIGPQLGHSPEVDEAVSKLDAAITHLMENDEGLRNFLTYKGALHNYSWLNLLLIQFDYMQRGHTGPILTMGYKGWLNNGRKVKPGSKAITLFKPILQYWRQYDGVTPTTKGARFDPKSKRFYLTKSRAVGFDLINKTFHIQDTDGPEFEPPTPVRLEDNSAEASRIYDEVAESAKLLHVTSITIEEMPAGYGGFYKPTDKSIHINCDSSRSAQAETLVHELAHHVSDELKLEHHEFYAKTRGAAETVAEGAAFVVMSSYGLDTTGFSVPYIAQWAGDLNKVRRLLRDIDKVSRMIIEKLPHGQKDK